MELASSSRLPTWMVDLQRRKRAPGAGPTPAAPPQPRPDLAGQPAKGRQSAAHSSRKEGSSESASAPPASWRGTFAGVAEWATSVFQTGASSHRSGAKLLIEEEEEEAFEERSGGASERVLGRLLLQEKNKGSAAEPIRSALLLSHRDGNKTSSDGSVDSSSVEGDAATSEVLTRLAAHPEEAKERDPAMGTLPLHHARSLALVNALLDAHPDAASSADHGGRLPLHHAESLAVVRRLLEAYPAGARASDTTGQLPLHAACEKQRPRELIAALLAAFSEGVREYDTAGRLPIAIAMEKKLPAEHIELLLEHATDGAIVAIGAATGSGSYAYQMAEACVRHVDGALTSSFVAAGHVGLQLTVRTYRAALAAADRARASNTEIAERLREAAERLQLKAAGLLELLSKAELEGLLSSPRGASALKEAIEAGCKLVLGRPRVQTYLQQRFLGANLSFVANSSANWLDLQRGISYNLQHSRALHSLLLLLNAALLHPLLLLLIAIYPPLASQLRAHIPPVDVLPKNGLLPAGAFLLHRVPIVTTLTHTLANLALAWQLSSLVHHAAPLPIEALLAEAAWTHPLWWRWLVMARWTRLWLAAWLLDAMRREMRRLYKSGARVYLSDRNKLLQLPGQMFALTALALHIAHDYRLGELVGGLFGDGLGGALGGLFGGVLGRSMGEGGRDATTEMGVEDSGLARGLLGIGVTLLWTSQLLRLLILHQTFGPFILMIFKMLQDVGKWIVILGCVLVPSAIGLHVVYAPHDAGSQSIRDGVLAAAALPPDDLLAQQSASGNDLEDAYEECEAMTASIGGGLGFTLILLVQRIFGGAEDVLQCIDRSDRPIAGGVLALYFSLMTIILLVNLLIAVMARTFDHIYESATLNYQQQLSTIIFEALDDWPVPPPLSLLSVPFYIGDAARSALAALCNQLSRCHLGRGHNRLADAGHRVGAALHAQRVASLLRRTSNEIPEKNDDAFTLRLGKMEKAGSLAEKVEAFVESHLGEELQEERQRTKMQKMIFQIRAEQAVTRAQLEAIAVRLPPPMTTTAAPAAKSAPPADLHLLGDPQALPAAPAGRKPGGKAHSTLPAEPA